MYRAQTTQENLAHGTARFAVCRGPDNGSRACGDGGPGRMLDPSEIVSRAEQRTSRKNRICPASVWLHYRRAHAREALDPVRFISNHSSGKMGFAIAAAAAARGADVTLIAGPVHTDTSGC